MRSLVKRLTEICGLRCFRTGKLPAGIDVYHDIRRLRGAIQNGAILDVGANVGRVTRQFAQAFPAARIYSFEPFPATYELLCRNTARLPRVKCVNIALGARQETRTAITNNNSEWNSLVPELNKSGESQPAILLDVPVTTIDQFCQENRIERIDVLKTDTEGFDLEVLTGARQMFESRSVDFVLSEAGFVKSDVRHTYIFDLHRALESFGFRFVSLYDVCLDRDGLHFCNALFKRTSNST